MTDHGGPNDPVSPPKAEFAFPGPLRDQLVGAILEGDKTTTTALLLEYERAHEPLPAVGARFVLVNSEDRPVAVLEVTNVRLARLVAASSPTSRCSPTAVSAPLHQGELSEVGGEVCITCPWRASVFRLRDGGVVHGPATAPVPGFESRVVDGVLQARVRTLPRVPAS
ncbi:MAG: nitrite reductase (NAD(P)H) small subunit [Pseudonocardiaceae bacterium]